MGYNQMAPSLAQVNTDLNADLKNENETETVLVTNNSIGT